MARNKVIITAALAGGPTSKANNPSTPYTPEEFAEESWRCWQEGCSIVHIHAKNPENGMPTADIDMIRPTIEAIRARVPEIIINMSSAISVGLTAEQRIAPIEVLKPEMASLNTNTMNFGFADRKTGKFMFEFIFENTFKTIEDFARRMIAAGVKPELEAYDPGGIYNALLLRKQGDVFIEPMHWQFVFGVTGGMQFSPLGYCHLKSLLPEGHTWSACGVGNLQFPAISLSCLDGGHMRVGLEDSVRVPGGALAKGSWEQVTWAKKIAQSLDREVATPDEARRILGLKPRE
ncbi:MAG TPA: 3-keto-5-aminohexanoate cleavage protein [Syntrophales bacterium]|nr:3-keto-5-aminohexanoate cleavage protein [Syntrophales bacterium]